MVPSCLRTELGTSDHPDRETLLLRPDKCEVAALVALVTDLTPSFRIASTLTRVDNDVALVDVIDVPAGHNDRVGTVLVAAADAGLFVSV